MSDIETVQQVSSSQSIDGVKFLIDNWLNIVFGIGGLVGTFFGIRSWKSNKKDKESYKYLFELAERNIDKDVTDESLKQKKAEVEKATCEIEKLQKKIKSDIPKEARRALLKDKLNTNCIDLAKIYNNIKLLKEELGGTSISEEIPPDLLSEIEKEISPEYLLREERDNLKTYLTICTTLAAILSAVLPWELARAASLLLLLAGGVVLFLLSKNIFRSASRDKKRRIATLGCIGGGVVAVGTAFLTMFLFAEVGYRERSNIEFQLVLGALSCLAFAALFSSAKWYCMRKSYSDVSESSGE